MEYVVAVAWHTVVLPVMVPGWEGVLVTVTGKLEAVEVPQALDAVTVIVPFVPAVAEMLLVVLVPVHPPGNVQV